MTTLVNKMLGAWNVSIIYFRLTFQFTFWAFRGISKFFTHLSRHFYHIFGTGFPKKFREKSIRTY